MYITRRLFLRWLAGGLGAIVTGCRQSINGLTEPLLEDEISNARPEELVKENVKTFIEKQFPGQTLFTWSNTWRDYYLTSFWQVVGNYHYYLKLTPTSDWTFSFKAMARQSFNPLNQGLKITRNGVVVYQYLPIWWLADIERSEI